MADRGIGRATGRAAARDSGGARKAVHDRRTGGAVRFLRGDRGDSSSDGNDGGDTSHLRRHLAGQQAYYEWVAAGLRLPLVERMFTWLDERWPADEGPTVLSWGDARIGNIMYRDFEVVGVLDWEMDGLSPSSVTSGSREARSGSGRCS
jgi:aminoglycoside phosphotransferase (APT) family kinase protein